MLVAIGTIMTLATNGFVADSENPGTNRTGFDGWSDCREPMRIRGWPVDCVSARLCVGRAIASQRMDGGLMVGGILHDVAIAQHDYAACATSDLFIVRDENDRDVLLRV